MTDQHASQSSPQRAEISALEAAIDSMSASDGMCLDRQHYHSFKGVSVLLPMRTCQICSRRLELSMAFANTPTVQCAACGILLHRTCAFGRTRELEVCPINFKKMEEQKAQDLASSLQEEAQDKTTESKNDEVPQLEMEPELGHEDGQSSITATVVTEETSSSAWGLSFPLFRMNSTAPISPRGGQDEGSSGGYPESATSPISPPTRSNHGDIFRPHSRVSAATQTTDKRHLIRLCYSEDGILQSTKQDVQSTKANFPFLSASALLPSQRREGGYHETSTTISDNEEAKDRRIQKSQSWGGHETIVLDHTTKVDLSTIIDLASMSESKSHDEEKSTMPCPPILEATNSRDCSVNDCDSVTDDTSAAAAWTADGPPAHWANSNSLQGLPSRSTVSKEHDGDDSEDREQPVHFASHPFASVSQALHQHILYHFRRTPTQPKPIPSATNNTNGTPSFDVTQSTGTNVDDGASPHDVNEEAADHEATPTKEMAGLLKETNPPIDKRTNNIRLGLATVAGGIAGGMAGLVVAGPVGGVIGAKFGQTAGILGLALEGSVAVGVITSGIAAGSHAGQQLQDRLNEDRVLTLGGDGIHRNVMLVRPSIKTDPVWEEIYAQARKSYPANQTFNILRPDSSRAMKRERYEREFDIVKTDEDEIPTEDKVLLLVSRILNNKESLPGHVYRELLDTVQTRANERDSLHEIAQQQQSSLAPKKGDDEDHDSMARDDFALIRARRQDTHAAIKYVTATFLEVRPGFAASPSITELTATAVEGLVFGGLYDMVFEEIEVEYEHQDNALLEKIAAFERAQGERSINGVSHYSKLISQDAVNALRRLPEAHSAVDKLRYCVKFLEQISEFFSSSDDCKEVMGADSLLKMVCQHIIVAKILSVNAQIAFLDEFARDEQLLRGREGYALVTIQASLHFLNACIDIENDIFGQDDDHD